MMGFVRGHPEYPCGFNHGNFKLYLFRANCRDSDYPCIQKTDYVIAIGMHDTY